MSRFVDRRPNGRHKSAVNRQRFIQRFKQKIREAVRHAIGGREIRNVDSAGEKIKISGKELSEPSYHFDRGGIWDMVLPGNKEYVSGDTIQRPPSGSGKGQGQAGNEGQGEDEFSFDVSKEELLDLFFEDLELPNLVKKQLTKLQTSASERAGFSTVGTPSNINIVRSMRGALGRRLAIGSPLKRQLRGLQDELESLKSKQGPAAQIAELEEQIRKLRTRINTIPFIDPFDLRYNNRVKRPKPTTQAVMFCLMDVSGSMDEAKKDIAKRFFILLYLFLSRTYESVDIVFIRHHTTAKEVDEHEFFYSRETGGTVVSSALELTKDILESRYSVDDWNVYVAQASDGDNWNNDSPKCQELLQYNILPMVQYYAYVEIMARHHQSLWDAYHAIKNQFPQFAMQDISELKHIYPVFRELFKRQLSTQ